MTASRIWLWPTIAQTTVSIRLGDGLGGFSGSTEVGVGSQPNSVAIGDFDADGNQDLAVSIYFSGTVSIRLGDGLGGFSGSTEVTVGPNPNAVAIGDFNDDGRQDLAVVNPSSNTVSIRLGDGLGGFSGSTNVSMGSNPVSVAIGDFNGEGSRIWLFPTITQPQSRSAWEMAWAALAAQLTLAWALRLAR